MVITYYGISCFKIQSGQITIIIDPFGSSSGLKPPRFQTDIALVSHPPADGPNHNYTDALKPKDGEVFLINGPGEYEYKGATIYGIQSSGKNTIFLFNLEDITIMHLGGVREDKLPHPPQEEWGAIDILFVPAGGGSSLDAKQAHAIIAETEPQIVIPMHYKLKNLTLKLSPVNDFLKEMGTDNIQTQDKLTIKAKDLKRDETATTQIVLLRAVSE